MKLDTKAAGFDNNSRIIGALIGLRGPVLFSESTVGELISTNVLRNILRLMQKKIKPEIKRRATTPLMEPAVIATVLLLPPLLWWAGEGSWFGDWCVPEGETPASAGDDRPPGATVDAGDPDTMDCGLIGVDRFGRIAEEAPAGPVEPGITGGTTVALEAGWRSGAAEKEDPCGATAGAAPAGAGFVGFGGAALEAFDA